MLAGLLSGRVGLSNCANNINLFLNAHTHSPGIEPKSLNVRDEPDPASTLSSLSYEKEDSQSSHGMISQLHTMFFRISLGGYLE